MRKLLAGALICATLCGGAWAAHETDGAADTLRSLGLFQGTGAGDELERVPTRPEAVTMLVRLLGKEGEAKTGAYETPFADVPDWAAPYVGYAYAKGLTTGTGADTFGSNLTVDGNQYVTMLLRALGYTSGVGGDFQWDGALVFGASVGLPTAEGAFLRGDVAEFSLVALTLPRKDGGATLLDLLVAEGAVDPGAAARLAPVPKPVWEGTRLLIPEGATNAYVLQAFPQGEWVMDSGTMTEAAAKEFWGGEDLYLYHGEDWSIALGKRYCYGLDRWLSGGVERTEPLNRHPDAPFVLSSLDPDEDILRYSFLLDKNDQILAYWEDSQEEGEYLDTVWVPQRTDCVAAVEQAEETYGTCVLSVDRYRRYDGWDDGSGTYYRCPVDGPADLDWSQVRYLIVGQLGDDPRDFDWRTWTHYILHSDGINLGYTTEDDGTMGPVETESATFGELQALAYVEEAGSWCVWTQVDVPMWYLFYTVDGQMLWADFKE